MSKMEEYRDMTEEEKELAERFENEFYYQAGILDMLESQGPWFGNN